MPNQAQAEGESTVNKNKDVSLFANIEGIARAMFNISEEDVLLLNNIFDSKGQLRLYHPVVQSALLKLIKAESSTELKKIEAEKKAKAKKCKGCTDQED